MNRGKIVVVGSSNTDMVVKAPRLPGPGETVLGGAFAELPGGKGANQAVAAARLGAAVTFIGCVGEDALGDRALDGLRAEGIDTRFVMREPRAPSGVALIVVDEAGENLIAVAPGANSLLTADAVERAAAAFDDADILLLQLEVPLDAVTRAIERARERGSTIILDPAPAQPVPATLLAQVDILTPNVHEARTLAAEAVADCGLRNSDCGLSEHRTSNTQYPTPNTEDRTPPALAAALLTLGTPCVMVSLGSDGVLMARPGESVHLPAHPVDAVDATAAGDAFAGALAAALAEGVELRAAAEFAVAASAISVTRLGAQPSLPSRGEVERLLTGAGSKK